MNVGINYAINNGSKYVMLLNSDTIASPDMMETLLSLSPLDAAIVSPGIYYFKSQNQLCSTGGKISNILLDTLRKAKIENPLIPLKLEFLPSHAWLIRTEIFNKSGLFDESYFPLYYDDLDYCLRLKRLGFNLYLIPAAKIYHNVSVSVGGKNSPKERYLMARNSGYYFRKNMRSWQAPFIFSFRLISAMLWTFRLLKENNTESIQSYWKGFYQGWFGDLPIQSAPID
ncbi:MAG: N-acetylglucosaminyl-diphospho-decaprenol L-rhamnosyltransferase [Firmicutes bacterium ADurb.Bin419]|nr:MAG: N-acetylglucosaminyl-diphospho-decaprenol L-rhamnosyltransferase [Firmicutes bacterium ADurb.Bin419]